MENSKILLLTGITVFVLFLFFYLFRKGLKGENGSWDKQEILYPIYTLFIGYALFLGDQISDFKFACLIGGSAGVDMITSILSAWTFKNKNDNGSQT